MDAKTKLGQLHEIISKMKHVYWYNDASAAVTSGTLGAPDIELPVLEDGANVDTGAANLSFIKLTTGQNWAERATREDPEISFQVASVAGAVNDLLLSKVEGKTLSGTLDGVPVSGNGYSNELKKVSGALLLTGEKGEGGVFFPNAAMYSGFVGGDGDNPAYFNVLSSFAADSNNVDFYILRPTVTGGE